MKSWHDFDALKILELAAHAGNACLYFEQISQRGIAHHDDNFRTEWLRFPETEMDDRSRLLPASVADCRAAGND